MNLAEQMDLINYMIKKDPDSTIKDFLEETRAFDTIRQEVQEPIVKESKLNEWVEEAASISKKAWGRLKQKKYLRTYKLPY